LFCYNEGERNENVSDGDGRIGCHLWGVVRSLVGAAVKIVFKQTKEEGWIVEIVSPNSRYPRVIPGCRRLERRHAELEARDWAAFLGCKYEEGA
jgi:hypothetical protein